MDSNPLALEIEGTGKDGQILVVCGWPNFCVQDMPQAPKPKQIVIHEVVEPDMAKPKVVTGTNYSLIIAIIALILAVAALFKRNARKGASYG